MSNYLKLIKLIVVLGVAATLTVTSFNFANFELLKNGAAYGIWRGFPLGYYFAGTFVDWSGGGPFPSWLPLSFWKIGNWILDFAIWFILAVALLLLIEFGLKKLFKIEW